MKKIFLQLALVITVLSHYILFIVLVGSVPFLFIYEPWYVSIPVVVWLLNLMTLPVRCPLTTLENKIRRVLGLKTIRGFVSYWILWRRNKDER
jgi:uncharacterized membrane protein